MLLVLSSLLALLLPLLLCLCVFALTGYLTALVARVTCELQELRLLRLVFDCSLLVLCMFNDVSEWVFLSSQSIPYE